MPRRKKNDSERTLAEAKAMVGKTVRRYVIMHPREEPRDTHLVTAAWETANGDPVVMLEGYSGFVHADAVELVGDATES